MLYRGFCGKARLYLSDGVGEGGVYFLHSALYLVEHFRRHIAVGFDRFPLVFVNADDRALDIHFRDPFHFFRRGMDTEKVHYPVPNGRNPPGDFIPKPPGEGLYPAP